VTSSEDEEPQAGACLPLGVPARLAALVGPSYDAATRPPVSRGLEACPAVRLDRTSVSRRMVIGSIAEPLRVGVASGR